MQGLPLSPPPSCLLCCPLCCCAAAAADDNSIKSCTLSLCVNLSVWHVVRSHFYCRHCFSAHTHTHKQSRAEHTHRHTHIVTLHVRFVPFLSLGFSSLDNALHGSLHLHSLPPSSPLCSAPVIFHVCVAATKALAANVATPTSTPTALCAQSATRHLVRCPFVRLSPELHLKEAQDASYPSSLPTPHSAPAPVPGPDSGPLEGPGRRKQNLLLSRKRHRRCLTRCWFLVCRVPLPLALCLIFNVQLQRCLYVCLCVLVCVCLHSCTG